MELLGRYRVNCIHNVNSNLKLASGHRFLCSELLQAGANVCLGTDSTASSNNLDMPEAMKTAALLQKGWRLDTSALPLQELLDMATVNGAKALGIDAGAIRPGALADIAIIDTDHSWFVSPGPFLANFIYAAHSECIDSLICNGRFVMRRREIAAEEEVKAAARRTISKYY